MVVVAGSTPAISHAKARFRSVEQEAVRRQCERVAQAVGRDVVCQLAQFLRLHWRPGRAGRMQFEFHCRSSLSLVERCGPAPEPSNCAARMEGGRPVPRRGQLPNQHGRLIERRVELDLDPIALDEARL
jgi:hypothetical protein